MKLFVLLLIIKNIFNLCTLKQDCTPITDPNCKPSAANFTQPFKLADDPKVVCKEFIGKDSCCTPDQNVLLLSNFIALDAIFNTNVGGCDICTINLKRLWCYFTCSPDQHKFGIF